MNISSNEDSIIDFVYTFPIPAVCFFGILANALNILILKDSSLKIIIYKYLLIHAISNFIYYIIVFFIFLSRCGSYCTIGHSFLSQFYLYLFYNYIKNIASSFSLLIELLVSLQRLLFVSNVQYFKFKKIYSISVILVLVSIIINLPFFLSKKLKFNLHYSVVLNEFGKSELGKWLVISIPTIKGLLIINAILVTNFLTVAKLKKRIEIKKTLIFFKLHQSKEKSLKTSRNLTLMVVVISFLNFFAYLPNLAAYIMQRFLEPNNKFLKIYLVCSTFIFLLVKASDVFVFYFFNKCLKKKFKKIIKECFSCDLFLSK